MLEAGVESLASPTGTEVNWRVRMLDKLMLE